MMSTVFALRVLSSSSSDASLSGATVGLLRAGEEGTELVGRVKLWLVCWKRLTLVTLGARDHRRLSTTAGGVVCLPVAGLEIVVVLRGEGAGMRHP